MPRRITADPISDPDAWRQQWQQWTEEVHEESKSKLPERNLGPFEQWFENVCGAVALGGAGLIIVVFVLLIFFGLAKYVFG